ncbi:MAG TPA: hypothetical protein VIZ65_08955 [Cellvibrionaceae bacterium]
MSNSVLPGLIGGLVSVALCFYISKSIRKAPADGQLRFGKFMLIIACCCLAFVIGAFILAFFLTTKEWSETSTVISVLGLIIGFGIGAFYCFGEYYKVHGTYNEEGIFFSTPWTGEKEERWGNLNTVKFNGSANWYLLTFKSGKKIRLSNMLYGYGSVLELLKSKGYNF